MGKIRDGAEGRRHLQRIVQSREGGLDVAPRPSGGVPKDMPMMSYTFGGYRAPQEAGKSGLIKVGGQPSVRVRVEG